MRFEQEYLRAKAEADTFAEAKGKLEDEIRKGKDEAEKARGEVEKAKGEVEKAKGEVEKANDEVEKVKELLEAREKEVGHKDATIQRLEKEMQAKVSQAGGAMGSTSYIPDVFCGIPHEGRRNTNSGCTCSRVIHTTIRNE